MFRVWQDYNQPLQHKFSLGTRLFDRPTRDAIYAIYGFVRFADEIVDSFHQFNKPELLALFKADTYKAIEEGISLNPILQRLSGCG